VGSIFGMAKLIHFSKFGNFIRIFYHYVTSSGFGVYHLPYLLTIWRPFGANI